MWRSAGVAHDWPAFSWGRRRRGILKSLFPKVILYAYEKAPVFDRDTQSGALEYGGVLGLHTTNAKKPQSFDWGLECGGEIGIYCSQARALRAIAFSRLRHGQCAFASLR
ncbi:hypothetical protein C9I90_14180 [Photobacterium aphoticum]|uniref:Uncharacterized protein n=1 Tax=Photobacterium aphoticum TaxID=754436 RepID=A0A0J1GIN5_9GAMM|nr:hypothetical protein ABT58_17095 [Photobacterium aphoticum]PSU56033.1 hypothetical protein C9I90_14180 [Photobacterium aphoticum]